MWCNTSGEEFVLLPKHAAVFRRAASDLSDRVGWEKYEDNWYGLGVAVFDELTQPQRQAAILAAAKALLGPDVAPPEVTAVLAGTVDAIYRQMQGSIEIEIDEGEGSKVRGMLLDAMHESNYWQLVNEGQDPTDEPAVPPAIDCEEYKEWADLVEDLWTGVLDDYDFDMADKFLDMPPEQAEALKRRMNIDPEYFVAVADDPTPEQLEGVRKELHGLLW
jgi:hypothetical protein